MNKEKVYLIRGKNGEYAKGTKICASSRGANSTMSKFIEGRIYLQLRELHGRNISFDHPLQQMYTTWCWGGGKQHFNDWDTFQRYNDAEIRSGMNVKRIVKSDYDIFAAIVNNIHYH